VGAEQLALHVAQAALDGSAMSFKFRSRPELVDIIAELHKGSARVAGSPHVAADTTDDQARLYGERFVDKWGEKDGCRLVTGARGWELFQVQPDDSFGACLCARPSWGTATAATCPTRLSRSCASFVAVGCPRWRSIRATTCRSP
jgi:hypothetical protein